MNRETISLAKDELLQDEVVLQFSNANWMWAHGRSSWVLKRFAPLTLPGKVLCGLFEAAGAALHDFEAVGGHLFLTSHRLVFGGVAAGDTRGIVTILLPAIAQACVTSRMFGLVRYLTIETQCRFERFVLYQPTGWVAAVNGQCERLSSERSLSIIRSYLAFHGLDPTLKTEEVAARASALLDAIDTRQKKRNLSHARMDLLRNLRDMGSIV